MNFSRTSFRKPLLATALALAGLGIAGQANAASYSYARAELKDFAVVFGGDPLVDGTLVRTRQTFSNASYTGYSGNPPTANSVLFTGTGVESDTLQSFAGPGTKPAENDFTRALTNTYGARGDAYTSATLNQVVNVSESHVVTKVSERIVTFWRTGTRYAQRTI